LEEAKYSICITHFNNAPTVKQSLESILKQIDDEFEVIVVDNKSTDGSYEILKEFESAGKIKLIQARCSRGRGREIAFENSGGKYVIANMDTDDIFKPRLRELLARYHAVAEGKLLRVRSSMESGFWGGGSINIAPRRLITELGGWRDLQIYEDSELDSRAARLGKFCWGEFALFDVMNPHAERRRTLVERMKWRYALYRDGLRTGYYRFSTRQPTWRRRLLKAFMRVFVVPFYESYVDQFNYGFRENDPVYSISLEEPQ
jgi:glycosyltransferase involved in cell wall biosynthesis